jgi:endonuclease/exonuclease/phosphatase family metal-dependent hydrolase
VSDEPDVMMFTAKSWGLGSLANVDAGYWWILLLACSATLVVIALGARLRRLPRQIEAACLADRNEFQQSIDINHVRFLNRGAERGGTRQPGRIRLLSWNVGRGYQPDQLLECLRAAKADVVLLQEVDWNCRRTRFTDVVDLLASRLQMQGYFGVEFLEICTPLRPKRMAGGGATGNALLVDAPVVDVFRIDLPAVMDWAFNWNDPPFSPRIWKRARREKRVGGRFALVAELRFAGRPLVVCSTHLEDFTGGVAGRFAQYRHLVDQLAARYGDSTASVIAGDFNTFDTAATRWLRGGGGAAALGKPTSTPEASWWKTRLLPETGYGDPFDVRDWTFQVTPIFRPKLDWITVKAGRVLDRGMGAFGSSDHRPIWVDLEWLGSNCR